MTAADILRERADDLPHNMGESLNAAQLRAVAELMDACRKPILVQGSYRGDDEADMVDAEKCAACECIDYHATDCPLAALERLITNETHAATLSTSVESASVAGLEPDTSGESCRESSQTMEKTRHVGDTKRAPNPPMAPDDGNRQLIEGERDADR